MNRIHKTGYTFGREENQTDCKCERPSKNIICRKCGHIFKVFIIFVVFFYKQNLISFIFSKGRCRMACDKHPKVVYLMDIEACLKCNCRDLKEF